MAVLRIPVEQQYRSENLQRFLNGYCACSIGFRFYRGMEKENEVPGHRSVSPADGHDDIERLIESPIPRSHLSGVEGFAEQL